MSKVPQSPEEQREEIRRRMPGCLSGIPWIYTYAMYQSMSVSYNKSDWFRFAVGCLFWVYIVAQSLVTVTPTGEAKAVHRAWGWAGYAVTACAAPFNAISGIEGRGSTLTTRRGLGWLVA